MTFVLDLLEKRGLAIRAPHPSDRRRKRIELTAKGAALGARMLADLLAFESVALAAIPGGDLGAFKHLVECYARALASPADSH
jgi:DNA-binding MarR family transcriptional regulator